MKMPWPIGAVASWEGGEDAMTKWIGKNYRHDYVSVV
jgi:hypothetical protein